MRVDPALLRMGADFSDSAGAIAGRGADQFASAPLPAGIFGDFAEAKTFHQALSRAHTTHATSMQGHRSALAKLAENAVTAARIFTDQDQHSASSIEAAQPS